jgi:hypothetical protein
MQRPCLSRSQRDPNPQTTPMKLTVLTSAAASLALGGLAFGQADVLLLNDSFDSTTSTAEDQILRIADLDSNGFYGDSVPEFGSLFQFAPAGADNYQFLNVRTRVEAGEGVVYLVNNRFPGGFRPEVLRGFDADQTGRIELDEMVQLLDLEAIFGSSQGAEGVVAHPDGSVWAVTDFPGGGIVRHDLGTGTNTIFVDASAGFLQSTNASGVLATVDSDDFTRASHCGTGIISFIDGFGTDRTEAIFKFEDLNGNDAGDDNELTPFMVPTDINPDWAANPDFGTVLPTLEVVNPDAGMSGQPPFFVGRLNHLATANVGGEEIYYFACDSSNTSQFGTSVTGDQINGLIFQGIDGRTTGVKDGDCNDPGEVTLFWDGSADSPNPINEQFDKILGIDAVGNQLYVFSLNGGRTVSILEDTNNDGVADNNQFQVFDDGLYPGLSPVENFLFGVGMAALPAGLIPEPATSFASQSGDGCTQYGPAQAEHTLFGDPINGLSSLNYRVMTNVPFGAALYYASVNDNDYAGIPLPLDAGLFGLPGCTLYISLVPTAVVAQGTLLGSVDGSYTVPLPIPLNPSLVNAVVHFQSIGVDPTTFAVSVTNKLSVTIQ